MNACCCANPACKVHGCLNQKMNAPIFQTGGYNPNPYLKDTIPAYESMSALEKENAMLREALRLIANHPVDDRDFWDTAIEEMQGIARTALKFWRAP